MSIWYPPTTNAPRSGNLRERYWTPELLLPTMLSFRVSSKFCTSAPCQMRKVFDDMGFSSEVAPWMTPSLTDHSLGSPFQPARSSPLNRDSHLAASSFSCASMLPDGNFSQE